MQQRSRKSIDLVAQRREHIAMRAVRRMRGRQLVHGWDRFVGWTEARRGMRRKLAKTVSRMRGRCAAAAFNAWLSFLDAKLATRATIASVFERWTSQQKLAGFRTSVP
jgi:hypothetical protein